MKKNIIIIDKKDKFEYLPQANLAMTLAIVSLGYLNLLVFYYF